MRVEFIDLTFGIEIPRNQDVSNRKPFTFRMKLNFQTIMISFLIFFLCLLDISQSCCPQNSEDSKCPASAQVDACDPTSRPALFVESSGTLTSKGYPASYPNNLDCHYFIRAEYTSRVVTITFIDIYTESSRDFIHVHDGSSVLANELALLNGYITTALAFSSTQQYMLLRFTSDSAGAYRGFSAYYFSSTSPVVPTSTMPTTADTKTTEIENLPNNATTEPTTVQTTADPTTTTAITSNTYMDSTTTGNLQSDACSPSSRPVLITESFGWITSVNYPANYSNNMECEWLIQSALENEIVTIQFTDFYTEKSNDFVYVHDGKTASAPLLARLDGVIIAPFAYSSTQRYLLLRFTSDNSIAYRGFRASFVSSIPSVVTTMTTTTTTSTTTKTTSFPKTTTAFTQATKPLPGWVIPVTSIFGTVIALLVVCAICWICYRICHDVRVQPFY